MNDGKLELCIYFRLNFQSTHMDRKTKQCIGGIYEVMYGVQMRTVTIKFGVVQHFTHTDDDISEKWKKICNEEWNIYIFYSCSEKKKNEKISKATHENSKWRKIDFMIFAKIAVGIDCESIVDMKHVEDSKRKFIKFRYFPSTYKSMNKRYGNRRWIQYTIHLSPVSLHRRVATKPTENVSFGYSNPKMGIIGYRKEIGSWTNKIIHNRSIEETDLNWQFCLLSKPL